ncbi:MAG: hypothetical protein LQ350_004686 [Teloschistes chrysophthalmus]|nr:MAG: hypothetical protein LQ350_004686 [Niorma chrysophthalma]
MDLDDTNTTSRNGNTSMEKHFIRPIQLAIVFLVVTNIILTLLWIFQCNPIAGAWNKSTPSKCFTDAQLLEIIISQAIISIISDFALALFPIALLWKIQIDLRIKAGLCALMALGLITAACCIVRTVMNWQNVTSDTTWTSVDNWYWRAWEVNIGIIAACIPPLRPAYATTTSFVKSYMSRAFTQRSTAFARIKEGKSSKAKSDEEPITRHQANSTHQIADPLEAASHAASAENDRARIFGMGEEGFAMNSLPGDKSTKDSQIKKTTRVDVEISSQRSLTLGGGERGKDGTYFV